MKQEIPLPLTPDELAALDGLCDLAHRNGVNHKKLLADPKAKDAPPLRLQNLTLPARVRAVRVMIDFAAGAKYADSLEKHGLTALEFSVIRHKDPDFNLAWESAKRMKAADTAMLAADGLRRLTTEEGCGLNVKAVLFALERLDGATYAKPDSAQPGGASAPKSVYNIVINGFSGPQPCDNLATNPDSAPVIDVNPYE